MIENHELNIFVHVADTLSFTDAAKRLHISQPAVSMQISNLEGRLDTILFDRSGRSIRPTEAAEVLLPMAREMLNYATHIEETMASLHGSLTGHLQIACSTSAGKYVLPHLIAEFRERHPDVRVTVSICSPNSAIDRVCDGRSQLGILSSEAGCRDVEYRRFFVDRVVLIAPNQHPWAKRESVKPNELVGQPFILREETAGTYRVMQAGLLEHGIRVHDLDVVMELGNAEAIESSVEAGIGVAFVSRLVARRGIEAGTVAQVAVDGLDLRRDLNMIRSSRRAETRVQAAFWAFVHSSKNKSLLDRVVEEEDIILPLVGVAGQ
jgi:DNA-binding transcriptional LysR family regulator